MKDWGLDGFAHWKNVWQRKTVNSSVLMIQNARLRFWQIMENVWSKANAALNVARVFWTQEWIRLIFYFFIKYYFLSFEGRVIDVAQSTAHKLWIYKCQSTTL